MPWQQKKHRTTPYIVRDFTQGNFTTYSTELYLGVLPTFLSPRNGSLVHKVEEGKENMIGNAAARFTVALFYLTLSLVSGAVRFVVALLGPGLVVLILAALVVLWYFGWFSG